MRDLFLDLGIELTNDQLEKFDKYYELLVEWNEKVNLTAIVEKKEVFIKHFYDSLAVLKVYNFRNELICDIGSGAGFPGIPLKIVYPEISLTIVDSLRKRIDFLNMLSSELNLNVNAVHARAEDYIKFNREKFDVVFARAVARLNILSELCIPYVKVGGYFIALKGSSAIDEVRSSVIAFKELGADLDKVINYQLPSGLGERALVKVKKKRTTNKKYPRSFGKIKKLPL
ncbi:16S rRNA (guanine(527)-N(7))-methyltransferase RsmG [Mycoplasmatota bacterium zrk1]